jgi:hypothetical protein
MLEICNQMILKYSRVNQSNYEIVNEILELYRFIVEKYAGFVQVGDHGQVSPITIVCELA